MNVVVFGAAGKTGRAVVDRAKAAGHTVTAFVHHAGDYDVPDAEVREGNARDPAAVDAALAGQDAVIDTIGGRTPYEATTLESGAARTIIASMRRQGACRLVVTCPGLHPRDRGRGAQDLPGRPGLVPGRPVEHGRAPPACRHHRQRLRSGPL